EHHAHTALEATQATLVHQIQAELPETEPRPVIAETGAEEHAQGDVGDARCVAVAMFQAEVRHPADDEAEQILVGKQGWRQYGGEHVQRGAPLGVRHQGQIDELLDRAIPDLAPDALVFSLDLLLRRVRGPSDTDVPEIVET